jgi:hypothetical protein
MQIAQDSFFYLAGRGDSPRNDRESTTFLASKETFLASKEMAPNRWAGAKVKEVSNEGPTFSIGEL